MKYTIDSSGSSYIVKKNNQPVCLEGVGSLVFYSREEAERYISMVYECAYYISQGIPE